LLLLLPAPDQTRWNKRRGCQPEADSMHMRVSRPDDQSPKPCSFHPPLRPCRFHDGAGRFCGNRGNSAELGRCNPSSRSSWVTLSNSPFSRRSGLNPGQEALPQTPSRQRYACASIFWCTGIRQGCSITIYCDDARLRRKI